MSDEIKDEGPPFLKTWPRVYALVMVELAALIAVFYFFTVHFRP